MVHDKIVDVLIRYFVLIGASWAEGVWGIALIALNPSKEERQTPFARIPRARLSPPQRRRGQRDAALGVYKFFGMKYL